MKKANVRPSCFLISIVLLLFACFSSVGVFAQTESDERALINVKDGLSFSKDSLFLLNLRFRMQNRIGLQSLAGDDLNVSQVDARVRRLRLRLDGYVLTKKLQYYIQLSFSKADQELETSLVPQTIRDAVLYYNVNKHLYFGFGQAKLPGNRQRVISSGNQQFADRSIANNELTVDRDFGLFGYYTLPTSLGAFKFKTALSTGEGRGASPGDDGIAYTYRVEWLPNGDFKNAGDYSEGDIEREQTLKVSLAAGYHQNQRAKRTGGQLGLELYEARDIGTFIADAVFKYNGWAWSTEFLNRSTDNPLTFSPDSSSVRLVYEGYGVNSQLSYFTPSGLEYALRYSILQPAASISAYRLPTEELWFGLNKYLNGHRIKLQWHTGYRWINGNTALNQGGNRWFTMFQVEFGI
ncbi:MAG: porin [Sphingobacteriaceae bacterium]|nr:porin [Sphingobacteriaceae bacterium]